MVCKKSGLAHLAEGIGAGAATFSAHACCHCGGMQHGSDLQGGTQTCIAQESPVKNYLLIGQPSLPSQPC